jgi:tRNA wybutosine-synthesizing protein 1
VGYSWATQFASNPPLVEERNNYTGSYRKTIAIPAAWKGMDIYMHVGSATSNLQLWVNGKEVGYSEDSKMEAEFNLTKYLTPGRDNLIAMQRKHISGFKGDERCDPQWFEEAMNPNQVACSLAGEPTEYPYLSEFFKECHSRGMTTFLVTNGTNPDRIAALETLPRMLYVTVAAPNEEVYKRACRPKIRDGWERIMKTLELFPSLETRTCIRHTLVQNYNLCNPEGYAKLDNMAQPDLIEPKGYVFVGGSRQRLTINEMPEFSTIKDFANRLGELTGMQLLKEKADSRVCLLGTPGMNLDVRRAWENGYPSSPRLDKLHN